LRAARGRLRPGHAAGAAAKAPWPQAFGLRRRPTQLRPASGSM